MKKILIGTHNVGKFKEIAYLISKKYKKISPISLKIKSPKETGKSFISNSKLKVNFFSKYVKYPVISDDSGLCINALKNKPGIYSARWAGLNKNFNSAMSKINTAIKEVKQPNYDCYFICSLSISWPDKFDVTVSGKVHGKFSWPPKGDKGFGYDPIFRQLGYNMSFAEMDPNYKHKISHRSIAFNKLINLCFPNLKC